MNRLLIRTLLTAVLAGSAALPARAQVQVAQTPPDTGESVRSAGPVLERVARLEIGAAPLAAALARLSEASGVTIAFSPSVIAQETRAVSCACAHLTVRAALDLLLAGTGFQHSEFNGQVIVYRPAEDGPLRSSGSARYASLPGPGAVPDLTPVVRLLNRPRSRQEPGTIIGRVTAVEGDIPLASVQVSVDGAGRVLTNNDGRYRIARVEPGRHTVSVNSIGYAAASQEVEVGDGATVVVDFALDVSPSTLDDLVVTATGEQRRVELGHVVGRINADSIVKAAPISTLSELLTGRVPGLQVFTHSGQVGGRVKLQLRAPNSISLGSDPILIVDGVRYANQSFGTPGPFSSEETSRLNDLNPNDIESIEVVKGPSAATLYGTDAANGVIVITTKRGRPGPARWNAYARATQNEIPRQQYPDAYWGWGTVFGTPSSPFTSCTLRLLASGRCTQQDSVAVLPNPLNDPELTVLHSKPGWEYGANVSGAGQDMRYYFSADMKQATGPIQMPTATIKRLMAERGVSALPDEQLEPNAQRQLTLRGNVTLGLGSTAELRFSSGYGHTSTRTQQGVLSIFRFAKPSSPYDRNDPADLFSSTSTEGTDRVFGSVLGQWRPRTWLQGRATLGVDLADSDRSSLALPGQGSSTGLVGEGRTRQLAITGDVGLSTHARLGRLSSRTAVGAQYTRQKMDAVTATGIGLPPGGESVGQAANTFVRHDYDETATLGSYLEETIGLNDRLFVTGALRVDGASNFGRDYKAATYPKASASWLVSEEPFLPRLPGLDELRLRYAFGASGQQPRSFMTLPEYATRDALIGGVTSTAIWASQVGNPDLRPERVREHEVGLDATGLAGRVQLGLTWYDRTTTDQIVSRRASLGFGHVFRNLGRLSANGFEADLTVRPVETRFVTWGITLQHAVRRTTVEDLGGLTERRSTFGGFVEGYPLGARFATEILGWDDANGDGILVPAELAMSEEPVFQGESMPPRTQTLSTSVGLFQQRVRLSALLQRQSGHTQINGLSCRADLCRAAVDPSTPLEAQALLVAPSASHQYADIEPADHTRLQEMTVAVDVPEGLLRTVRLRSGTVSVSGRNLALWTSFSGPDPASVSVRGFAPGIASNIPQSRTWVVRLDLGW